MFGEREPRVDLDAEVSHCPFDRNYVSFNQELRIVVLVFPCQNYCLGLCGG